MLLRKVIVHFVGLCLSVAAPIVMYIYVFVNTKQITPKVNSINDTEEIIDQQSGYLIKTDSCSIPMMQLYTPEIAKFTRVQKVFPCVQDFHDITFKDGYHIFVNKTCISLYFPTFTKCYYIPFKRSSASDNSFVDINERKVAFTSKIEARDEFVTVKCYTLNNSFPEVQRYSFIFKNKGIGSNEAPPLPFSNHQRPLNIILFGLESTSRLQFIRHMDMTYSYLTKEMHAVEMLGYNKVGANTLPNVVAMMTGRSLMDYKPKDMLDDYPFVWKDFEQAGYKTFYGEDHVKISTFNHLQRGFNRPPVHHYVRPFMVAMEMTRQNQDSVCSGNKLIMQYLLENVMDFSRVYKDVPHFAFTMVSKLTHDDPNGHGYQDIPYYNLVKQMNEKGYLRNSVVIFVSDHGLSFGQIRFTLQGRLEENLPALFISFPFWFRQQHAELFNNLKANAFKLTNNFDIYATFRDILSIGQENIFQPHVSYGVSMLRTIPSYRSCPFIGISSIFCTCASLLPVSSSNNIARQIGKYAVDEINTILKNVSDICLHLNLSKVLQVQQMDTLTHMRQTNSTINYLITLEVTPGGGVFEASVQYGVLLKTVSLVGQILQLNRYSGQSDCVKYLINGAVLRQYCLCKSPG